MCAYLLIAIALTGLVLLVAEAIEEYDQWIDVYDQWIAELPQGEKDGTSEHADITDRYDPV